MFDRSDSAYYANQPNPFGLTGKLAFRERSKMFDVMMRLLAPTSATTVVDVGVTADRREESNFFEKRYPYPHRVTAVGLEDAAFLEAARPGVKFVKTDGQTLPFADASFDVAVSFAVLEHAGNREEQRRYVRELCRVGKRVFLTTPNRWFPVEFHTVVPFAHWLPPRHFRHILRAIGQTYYSQEAHLNLLTSSEVVKMFEPTHAVRTAHHRLFGWVSNLMFLAEPRSSQR